ncbi:Cytidyltransferase-like domain [uncultured Caudovirales phage]|uniref:Cytidyltransferase-like domain n=1 Tax=uncultured Caudovirales phage TaxID=2100421 RepID=A0A6J5PFI5_9CAUD|nr:Cytidyltransferase-like domain [uncultured Caudovirales phage]CAB4170700.1 Cytidyltransferase-like domain [uncultured Caudovirales phage]CAB4177040.1 Cytidyltransferase-like domain [uncultured Caudovirales phage]CAB4223198.1 Cytidyltransferase-like domain [uncultured Caudovirales phage]
MISFKEFLNEEADKHSVITYGRMNPPTSGHLKVIDKVKEVAKKVGGSHAVVVSHSNDPKKNPLTSEQKIKHLKRYSADSNIEASDKEHPTIFHKAEALHKAGTTHLHIVAGSDRVKEYKARFAAVNGKPDKSGKVPFNFKKITVHSAGTRDPDAEGTTGVSGTSMREHAKNNDIHKFRKGVPEHVSDTHAKELMHDVRKGMNVT